MVAHSGLGRVVVCREDTYVLYQGFAGDIRTSTPRYEVPLPRRSSSSMRTLGLTGGHRAISDATAFASRKLVAKILLTPGGIPDIGLSSFVTR